MIKVTFVASDGERRKVEIEEGETAREAALYNDVPGIDGDCGGVLLARPVMCTSIPNGSTRWVGARWNGGRPLQFAEGTIIRRLACQIPMKPMLDGLVLHLPEQQY